MFSSIQIGMAAANSAPIAVLPGDMPFVRAETVRRLLEAGTNAGVSVVPRYAGRRGHPIVMPVSVQAAVVAAPAGASLRDVLTEPPQRRIEVEVDDPGVLRDVDVPEDLSS